MPARKPKQPNHHLRAAREQRGWSQKDVADKVGSDDYYVSRWERGVQWPGPHFRTKLCELFSMDAFALGLAKEQGTDEISGAAEAPRRAIWSVPFSRNRYCTGLDQLVVELRKRLMADHGGISLLTISGLGGIGKTQLALEYAHRYRKKYEAVLWVHADSSEHLSAALEQLARQLDVPEARKRQPKPDYLFNEVHHWLREHDNWLLILDNAEEDVELDFLSSMRSGGHVLLTTRVQSVADRGNQLMMEKMSMEVGALLLLRVVHDSSAPLESFPGGEREEAMALASILDGLPLALEQAGAYMREKGQRLAGYRRAYQRYRKLFLRWRSTHVKDYSDYSESVATTWLISFQRVRRQSGAALALLCLCAFLHPDAIPSDLILNGTYDEQSGLRPLAKDDVQLDHACGILINYALIRRNVADGMLSLHRLVQAVLKDRMSEQEQRRWAERTVRVVESAWSTAPESNAELYLPHAYVCARLIQECNMTSEEAVRLLEQAANAADVRGWYTKAAPLYRRAYDASAQLHGEDDPHVLHLGLDAVRALIRQGQYQMAAFIGQHAYQDYVRVFGPDHPATLACLNNLALAQLKEGSIELSLEAARQALELALSALNFESAEGAMTHQIVGEMCKLTGHDGLAEEHYMLALAIRERVCGPRHPEVAQSLLRLGALYWEHDLSQEEVKSAPMKQEKLLEQAEKRFRQALEIYKEALGEDHPETAYGRLHLGLLLLRRDDAVQAEACCRQAVTCFRRKLGLAHFMTGQGLHGLALALIEQQQYAEAERCLLEAKELYLRAGGPESDLYLRALFSYVEVLRATGREEEANQYEHYIKTTWRRVERSGQRLVYELPSLDEGGLPGYLFIIRRSNWDVPEDS